MADVIPISRDVLRARRKRDVRAVTEPLGRRGTKKLLRVLRDQADVDLELAGAFFSPATRGDCARVARPCPHVSCRHHLYLEVHPRTGALKLLFPDIEPTDLPPNASCALDVADAGGATVERVGELMNVTRARIGQIEEKIKRRPAVREALEHLQDAVGETPADPWDAIRSPTGGTVGEIDEDDDAPGNDEDRFRAMALRSYGHAIGSSDTTLHPRSFDRADDAATARWTNFVIAELRSGRPMREALMLANAADEHDDADVAPLNLFATEAASARGPGLLGLVTPPERLTAPLPPERIEALIPRERAAVEFAEDIYGYGATDLEDLDADAPPSPPARDRFDLDHLTRRPR